MASHCMSWVSTHIPQPVCMCKKALKRDAMA
jgi:hypothetical protein